MFDRSPFGWGVRVFVGDGMNTILRFFGTLTRPLKSQAGNHSRQSSHQGFFYPLTMVAVRLLVSGMAKCLPAGFIDYRQAGRVSFSGSGIGIIYEAGMGAFLIYGVPVSAMTYGASK